MCIGIDIGIEACGRTYVYLCMYSVLIHVCACYVLYGDTYVDTINIESWPCPQPESESMHGTSRYCIAYPRIQFVDVWTRGFDLFLSILILYLPCFITYPSTRSSITCIYIYIYIYSHLVHPVNSCSRLSPPAHCHHLSYST